MAQISIVNNLEIHEKKRIDPEFFQPKYIRYESKILSFSDHYTLTEIIHPTEFKRIYSEEGVRILLAQNIRDNYIDNGQIKYIPVKKLKKLKRSILKYDDVVMTRSGANNGQTAVFKREFKQTLACADILIIRSEGYGGYVSTYLNTKFGKSLIDRGEYGAGQPHIAPSYLRTIKVPKLGESFEKKIDDMINQSVKQKENSIDKYLQAEQLLLRELDLLDFNTNWHSGYETKSSDIFESERFDAEYFQPKYERVKKQIKSYHNGYSSMPDLIEISKDKVSISDSLNYNYIELGDLNSTNGTVDSSTEILGKELPSRARMSVVDQDVLLPSIEGSLSKVAIAKNLKENSIASTGFFVLRSNYFTPEVNLLLMKSYPIQKLLERESQGTILTAIPTSNLKNIVLPKLTDNIQSKLTELIQESHKALKESKELLEQAKREVEEMIESQTTNA